MWLQMGDAVMNINTNINIKHLGMEAVDALLVATVTLRSFFETALETMPSRLAVEGECQ